MKTALCALAFAAMTVGVSGQGHEQIPAHEHRADQHVVVVAGAPTSGTGSKFANRSAERDPGTVQARGDES